MDFKKYKAPLLTGAIGVAVFVILGLVLPTSAGNLLSKILIMMLFATSVNIMFGYGGLVAFGQAIFMGVGAYSYTILVARAGLPLIPSMLLAVLLTTLLSVLIGLLLLRVQALTFGLLSMGLNILFYNISVRVPQLGSGNGIAGNLRLAAFSGTTEFFYFVLVVTAVCYLLMFIFMHSIFANMARGIRENEERMVFLGVDIKRTKLCLIVISSFFASVAGVLYAMLNLGAYTPYLNSNVSIQGLVMCLVGGMFTFWGPSIGAIIITIVTTYVSNLTIYYNAVLGVILIATIMFFPSGILGQNPDDKNKASEFFKKLLGGKGAGQL